MIDYSLFKFDKGQPRAAIKIVQQRAASAAERLCRQRVDARDCRRCRFPGCKQTAVHKHHLVYRSHGGQWDPATIVSLCRQHHQWVHGGLVTVDGDANSSLTWRTTKLGDEAGIKIPARKAVA